MGYMNEIRKKVGHDTVVMVGAGVFVYKDGQVLLQRRKDNNCWAIHGGCTEIGETVEDTAKRELFEETGLIADSLELLGVFSGKDMIYEYPNGDKVYVVGVHYICRDFSGDILPESDEVAELKWFDIDNIPKNINPTDVTSMKAFIKLIKNS